MQVVGEATDGENAIQLAFADRPDLILLDIKMPPMNGVQVARFLRKHLPDVRIVVLTGYDSRRYDDALPRGGVDGFVSKEQQVGSCSQLSETPKAKTLPVQMSVWVLRRSMATYVPLRSRCRGNWTFYDWSHVDCEIVRSRKPFWRMRGRCSSTSQMRSKSFRLGPARKSSIRHPICMDRLSGCGQTASNHSVVDQFHAAG